MPAPSAPAQPCGTPGVRGHPCAIRVGRGRAFVSPPSTGCLRAGTGFEGTTHLFPEALAASEEENLLSSMKALQGPRILSSRSSAKLGSAPCSEGGRASRGGDEASVRPQKGLSALGVPGTVPRPRHLTARTRCRLVAHTAPAQGQGPAGERRGPMRRPIAPEGDPNSAQDQRTQDRL